MNRRRPNLRYRPWHISLRFFAAIAAASFLLTLASQCLVDGISNLPLINWVFGLVVGLELANIRPNRWAICAGVLTADWLCWRLTNTTLNSIFIPNSLIGTPLFWQNLLGGVPAPPPFGLGLIVSCCYIAMLLACGTLIRWMLKTNVINLNLLKGNEITRLLIVIGPLLSLIPIFVFFICNLLVLIVFSWHQGILIESNTQQLIHYLYQSPFASINLAWQQTRLHLPIVWGSHCLGVLLLSLLLLRIIPNAAFSQQERAVFTPFTAFLLLGVIGSFLYSLNNKLYLEKRFYTLAHTFQIELSSELEKIAVQLNAFKAFFESGSRIDESSFQKFYSGDTRNKQANLLDIYWLSRIHRNQRMPFERHLASAGILEPRIKDIVDPNTPNSSIQQPVYFPATYMSNRSIRKQVTGLDWYSHPLIRKGLLEAINSKKNSSVILTHLNTPPHFLSTENRSNQKDKNATNIILLAPVFHEQSHSSFRATSDSSPHLLPKFNKTPFSTDSHSKANGQRYSNNIDFSEANLINNNYINKNIGATAAIINLPSLISLTAQKTSLPMSLCVDLLLPKGELEILYKGRTNPKAIRSSEFNQHSKHHSLLSFFASTQQIPPHQHNFTIGNQLFRLTLTPLVATIFELQRKQVWIYSLTSVFISLCLLFIALHLSARDLLVRKIVVARTEHLRESTHRAEIVSQAKTRFLASMSHEFMTPLNAIIGFTRRVMDKEKNNLAPRHLSALESVENNGQKLLGIINNLINITDLEAGKVKLTVSRVNIEECLKESLKPLQSTIEQKGLHLRRFISYEYPIDADPQRLIEIFKHLLKNAVEYTNSGTITIFVKPEKRHQRRGVLIRIQDTGCGLSKEQQLKLLDERSNFNDINSRIHDRIGGIGAGFKSAKALIKLHQGELTLQSQVDKGTSVCIWLPAHQKSSQK